MTKKFSKLLCVLLCLCALFLCACVPTLEYQRLEAQGYYPKTEDFPYTKWVCRELDITINMLGNGECTMIGDYSTADTSYRVVAMFNVGMLDFTFYSQTVVSNSAHADKNGNPYVTCEPQRAGFLYTEYLYENGTINCTTVNAELPDGITAPEKLTFENIGDIATSLGKQWYCDQLDFSLDSYKDIDGYYGGQIVLNGKACAIQAFEIGNGNYYKLSIENGIINNYKVGTSNDLIVMTLEEKDGKLIGRISDDTCTNLHLYPDWNDLVGLSLITFSPLPAPA